MRTSLVYLLAGNRTEEHNTTLTFAVEPVTLKSPETYDFARGHTTINFCSEKQVIIHFFCLDRAAYSYERA